MKGLPGDHNSKRTEQTKYVASKLVWETNCVTIVEIRCVKQIMQVFTFLLATVRVVTKEGDTNTHTQQTHPWTYRLIDLISIGAESVKKNHD